MDAITTEVVDTGRKRDARGRRIVTEAERGALLAAYQQSGLTQRAFARREVSVRRTTYARDLDGDDWGDQSGHQWEPRW
jgi:hypothetical protein